MSMSKSDSENRWQLHRIRFLWCLLSTLCILSFPFPSHATEPDVYLSDPVYEDISPDAVGEYSPDPDMPFHGEIIPDTDGETGTKQTGEEMTVEENETKELQKRKMLEDYQIRDMAIDLYEKNDNQIMIMYSSGELGINAIEYRKLQREIESLRKSKESKRKIEENVEEDEETDGRNTVFANPREYEKFEIWEIAPLIALTIGLELLLVLYRPFEDEMLFPWEREGQCPK